MNMNALRWSDTDRYFGPFTYANENRPDGRGKERRRVFGAYFSTGGNGDDERARNRLRLHLLGRTLIVRLPDLMQPARARRTYLDADGHERGYWETWERSFGFLFVEGALHVDYGRQTHSSDTDKSKCWFLPWRSWRHVRRSFYGLNGEHVATLPDTGKSYLDDPGRWDRERAIEDACPTVAFDFLDFDGERITATTRIEEREWRLGEGCFKWLSLFARPKISRSLDIHFSSETGRRKGSWKGGTIGHSIGMEPGELHEAAFRRYCAKHDMTFVAPALAA